MTRMRLAVIGVGHLGQHHARILASFPEVELVGVVDANPDQAATVARRVRTKSFDRFEPLLAALAIRHEASPHDIVTLSAGVACWRSGQPATPVWLVGVADAALYAAKARGRNTFVTHMNAERAHAAPPLVPEGIV